MRSCALWVLSLWSTNAVPVSLKHAHRDTVNPDHYRIGLEIELPCAQITPPQDYSTVFAATDLDELPMLALVAERHNQNAAQIFELVFGPLPTTEETVLNTRTVTKLMTETLRSSHTRTLEAWLPLYNQAIKDANLDEFELKFVKEECYMRDVTSCSLCDEEDCGVHRLSTISKISNQLANVQVNYDLPLAAIARSHQHDWLSIHGDINFDGLVAVPPIRDAVTYTVGKMDLSTLSALDKCEVKGLLVLYTWMLMGEAARAKIQDPTQFKSWFVELPKVQINNLAKLLTPAAQAFLKNFPNAKITETQAVKKRSFLSLNSHIEMVDVQVPALKYFWKTLVEKMQPIETREFVTASRASFQSIAATLKKKFVAKFSVLDATKTPRTDVQVRGIPQQGRIDTYVPTLFEQRNSVCRLNHDFAWQNSQDANQVAQDQQKDLIQQALQVLRDAQDDVTC